MGNFLNTCSTNKTHETSTHEKIKKDMEERIDKYLRTENELSQNELNESSTPDPLECFTPTKLSQGNTGKSVVVPEQLSKEIIKNSRDEFLLRCGQTYDQNCFVHVSSGLDKGTNTTLEQNQGSNIVKDTLLDESTSGRITKVSITMLELEMCGLKTKKIKSPKSENVNCCTNVVAIPLFSNTNPFGFQSPSQKTTQTNKRKKKENVKFDKFTYTKQENGNVIAYPMLWDVELNSFPPNGCSLPGQYSD